MSKVAGYILKAKNILEGDYQEIRKTYQDRTLPVTRTENQTRCLIGGAALYIDRIIAASKDQDVDEDLYWAIVYLFMVIDEKEYNLDLDRFEKDTNCIGALAHKYRPEICLKED